MTLKTRLLAAVAIAAMAGPAAATPITGQISLGGFAQAVGGTAMGTATGIRLANQTGTSVMGSTGALA